MTNEQILNIFYTKVVPEAQTGKIDCYLMNNIPFDLIISNEVITKCVTLPYEGVLIPTLKITDKNLFDSLLVEYVKRAIAFYNPKDFAFLKELTSEEEITTNLIKYVICTLFANASVSDFEHPIAFLNSRIAMFDNRILDSFQTIDFGYIDCIKAHLFLKEEISPIKAETPYRIIGWLKFDDGYILSLPEIYATGSQDKYYLYGIQKTTISDEVSERPYLKQIRKGLIAKINGAPEHYFLAAMLFLSLCSAKEIEIIPFLIERWNAKRIALIDKNKKYNTTSLEEIGNQQERLQSGITDIILRYFTKLEDVTGGIEFISMPFDEDTSLHLRVNDNLQSRSILFNEIFALATEYKENEKNFKR